jgi:aldos-2-ulose dehydratase/isomerase family protein/VCBS repeat protein
MNAFYFFIGTVLYSGAIMVQGAEPAMPRFRAQEIDPKIEIGYGVTVADVDGDKKPDIILADKKQFVWYRNPSWERFVLAENLTRLDNVCVAAADVDGDGKAEIAVGAGWNPGDTVGSGAVFYLVAPPDRTQKWEAVELPHEPTVHRMKWLREDSGKPKLVVAPLHGRGNKDGEGSGVRILGYTMPGNPHDPWPTEVLSDSLHLTHNFDLLRPNLLAGEGLLVASKEGVFHLTHGDASWKSDQLVGAEVEGFGGAGEVRAGKLPGGQTFFVTVEPMHGNQLVVYTAPASGAGRFWKRNLIDDSFKEGHALACGDLLGAGFDQVVMGWRGKNNEGKTGIKLFTPLDAEGKHWRPSIVDDNTMACEDLCLADLNGDGKLDIVASGRATKNVKIYFNER